MFAVPEAKRTVIILYPSETNQLPMRVSAEQFDIKNVGTVSLYEFASAIFLRHFILNDQML